MAGSNCGHHKAFIVFRANLSRQIVRPVGCGLFRGVFISIAHAGGEKHNHNMNRMTRAIPFPHVPVYDRLIYLIFWGGTIWIIWSQIESFTQICTSLKQAVITSFIKCGESNIFLFNGHCVTHSGVWSLATRGQ